MDYSEGFIIILNNNNNSKETFMPKEKNKKNERLHELVKALEEWFEISTIVETKKYAKRALDDFDKLEMERCLHDEDTLVKGGIIISGIHIEGRLLKNANINNVVNELKKLKCWVEADRHETWSGGGGRWFIYHKADKDENVTDIAKAKKEFKNKYMHDVCLAISKLM